MRSLLFSLFLSPTLSVSVSVSLACFRARARFLPRAHTQLDTLLARFDYGICTLRGAQYLLSLAPPQPPPHPHTRALSLHLSLSLSHPLPLFLSHARARTPFPSLSLSPTHTKHILTQSLSVSKPEHFSLSHFVSPSLTHKTHPNTVLAHLYTRIGALLSAKELLILPRARARSLSRTHTKNTP